MPLDKLTVRYRDLVEIGLVSAAQIFAAGIADQRAVRVEQGVGFLHAGTAADVIVSHQVPFAPNQQRFLIILGLRGAGRQ